MLYSIMFPLLAQLYIPSDAVSMQLFLIITPVGCGITGFGTVPPHWSTFHGHQETYVVLMVPMITPIPLLYCVGHNAFIILKPSMITLSTNTRKPFFRRPGSLFCAHV